MFKTLLDTAVLAKPSTKKFEFMVKSISVVGLTELLASSPLSRVPRIQMKGPTSVTNAPNSFVSLRMINTDQKKKQRFINTKDK